MSGIADLTPQLRVEVLRLETDLRTRLELLPATKEMWAQEHQEALKRNRTAAVWEQWRDEQITQVAVAWVLTTVFIRFCEDNRLVTPVWLAGTGRRNQQALDAQQTFLREKARAGVDVTDRDWLLHAIEHLRGLRATANLVDQSSPMWLLAPSGDAATRLLDFWRARHEDGQLQRDFTDPEWDTRFLGDLYQDLSERAKKQYALLQTPVFVEEFILDRTLEPALAERPLDGFKAIDPTCGSGHFLLGIFARVLDRWHRAAPGMDERARVQKALDSVYGVDLNPFAVAIARFRLTLAALRASGGTGLENAPAFDYHLAVGDSLLFGSVQTLFGDADVHDFAYGTEDGDQLESILADGQYDTVVGNPPYITASDPALNVEYRRRYSTCHRKFQLTVPFMERFFGLAKSGEFAGWTGQITSNAFMKREFGGPLIERFLPTKDLRLVADTSGAYIPGHGTPTVIVVGRNTKPVGEAIRAVLGIRGEPGRPDEPSKGLVWSSITEHVDESGWTDEWITVADLDRALLGTHPWSLSGGGAVQLLAAIESAAACRLGGSAKRIGFFGIPGADDAMVITPEAARCHQLEPTATRAIVVGEEVRDFEINPAEVVWFPYGSRHELRELGMFPRWGRLLWRNRATLNQRPTFDGGARETWHAWHQLPVDADAARESIAFAEVATHNHFVLDRGGKVFKQTAPVIKLPAGATAEQHLELLGVLNASVACFWLKQNSYSKGNGGIGGGIGDEAWEPRYAFNASTVEDFPLPAQLNSWFGFRMEQLVKRANGSSPEQVVAESLPTRFNLDSSREVYESRMRAAIGFQEEIDWAMYRAYGLIDEDLALVGGDTHSIKLGQRAFEIVLARKVRAGEADTAWFARHGSTPITELPADWPDQYRRLVQRRIEVIESHPFIRLLERPEYKRRWASESWDVREKRALAGWLLDRLEETRFWFDSAGRPLSKSVQQFADEVGRDEEMVSVLALWDGRHDISVATMLQQLLDDQAVPFLAAYRYKDSGLRKRVAWERTWELQRQEDAGVAVGQIPVPPKYATADFVKQSYWSHRGKLDVPKERFILYPNAGRDNDPTPLLGWAGWDHAQQSLVLATLIGQREAEGWSEDRLVPLVAGLAELLPWVKQWHGEFDAFYGDSPASFFAEQLTQWSTKVRKTTNELAGWRPPPPTRGRNRRSAG